LEKAAIYIRVSTKKQADKYSPGEQKRILTEYATSRNWVIFDYYSDLGESGADSDREDLDRLLVDAEKKLFDKVLLFEQDRLSRLEQIDWAYLANSLARLNIKLITPTSEINLENEEDRFMADLFNLLANRELKKIKKRTSMGRKASNKVGTYFAPESPFGTSYDRDTNTWKVIPEESRIVRLMFDWYLGGTGFTTIGKRLKRLGYKTRKGCEFSGSVVYRIMSNTAHTGYYQQTVVGETCTHKINWADGHGPYVTQGEFEKMRNLAISRSVGQVEYFHDARYLLTGILSCGECHKKLRSGIKRYKAKDGEHVYLTYLHKPDTTCRVKHKVSVVDAKVMKGLLEMVGNADYIKKIMKDRRTPSVALPSINDFAEINSMREKLLNRKNKILDLFMDDDWTKEELLKKKKEIDNELQALSNREEEFNKQLMASEEKEVNIENLADSLVVIKNIGAGNLTIKEENSILREIISSVIISKDGSIDIDLKANGKKIFDPKYDAHHNNHDLRQ
jgi:DNA invertase Pin-like site-specific DNA recombinase